MSALAVLHSVLYCVMLCYVVLCYVYCVMLCHVPNTIYLMCVYVYVPHFAKAHETLSVAWVFCGVGRGGGGDSEK